MIDRRCHNPVGVVGIPIAAMVTPSG